MTTTGAGGRTIYSGPLNNYITWEVNEYKEHKGQDDYIFPPLQSWRVPVEAKGDDVFKEGKFAFVSDALKVRNLNWVSSHARQAAQLPLGAHRDQVLQIGRVSLTGGPWPSSGAASSSGMVGVKRKGPPVD